MRVLALVLFAVLVVGCAGNRMQGLRKTEPPLPKVEAGVVRADEVIAGKGGIELYARSYRPENGIVRAVVVFQHGLKDHGDHYAAFSQQLVKQGYATYAMDMRGHGRSAGERAAIEHFDDWVDDLSMYVERVRAREPGKPIFVFGHSAGGAIVTTWVIERHPDVAGIMLSAAALENDAPPMQIAAVALTELLNPNAPVFDLPNAQFSRDPVVVEEMTKDPLVFQDPGTVHLAGEVLDAIHRIWEKPEAFTLPLLAMHGTGDTVTAPSGTRNLVRRAGSKDKTLRLYDGHAHVLLADTGHEKVEADMIAWLDAHAGPGVAGATPSGPPPTSDLDAPIARELRGDRSPMSTAIEIGARGEAFDAAGSAKLGASADLRYRQGFGRIGFMLGIDLRIGGLSGFLWQADAHPLGFGARIGTFQLGLTGGLGGRGFGGTSALRTPIEIDLAGDVGPLRLIARGGVAWRLTNGGPGTSALGLADEATALAGVRIGRDTRYWGEVLAGAGPFVAGTYSRLGGVDVFGVALGLELWGAN